MQVLIVVLASLMMLSLMTYSRVSSYFGDRVLQSSYLKYIQETERAELNAKAYALYDKHHTPTPGEPSDVKQGPKLNRKQNINFLAGATSKSDPPYVHGRRLLKRLLREAYGMESFYRDLMEDLAVSRGLSEDEALNIIVDTIETEEKRKDIHSLAEAEFGDVLLRNAFVKMLNGHLMKASYDEKGHLEEVWEYPSLYKFLTISGEKKISIYLAEKPLLLAIYQDPALVSLIEEKRLEVYRMLTADTLTKAQGAEELKALVGANNYTGLDAELLDYNVSKTRPPKS